MGPGERTERGGAYVRVVGQTWRDPLDASHSKARGGRWNAPNSFGVIYLSRTLRLARLYVIHKLVGLPYGVEDLDPAAQDDLVELNVETMFVIDLVSASGLTTVHLPVPYPEQRTGRRSPGSVASRSATRPTNLTRTVSPADRQRPVPQRMRRSSRCSTAARTGCTSQRDARSIPGSSCRPSARRLRSARAPGPGPVSQPRGRAFE